MLSDIKPFRMAGNLYFVGTKKVSSHVIDTGDGLIMIDTGYPETGEVILESMEAMGLDIKDLKIILHSHGHYDHVGSTKMLKALSGAETYIHPADRVYLLEKYNADWEPDHDLYDGQIIRLGNTEILCKHTPGHTAGVMSFFFDLTHNGKTYRAGTYGGAGVRQVGKDWLERWDLSTYSRKDFFESIAMLKKERVDVFFGNHAWHNDTAGESEAVWAGNADACIDPTLWGKFLDSTEGKLDRFLAKNAHDTFVNYAHRGASDYAPENSTIAFSLGLYMGANGIEMDVRRTADGKLIVYHDRTLKRRLGILEHPVCEETYEQMHDFNFTTGDLTDKILTLEEYFHLFGFQDVRFAVELKDAGIAAEVFALLKKYDMLQKTTVTSFELDYLAQMRAVDKKIKLGYLTEEVTPEILEKLYALQVEELCPKACLITAENVRLWHRAGFNVRAWGVKDEETMKAVYDACADGMTVNFPDKLKAYIDEVTAREAAQ